MHSRSYVIVSQTRIGGKTLFGCTQPLNQKEASAAYAVRVKVFKTYAPINVVPVCNN